MPQSGTTQPTDRSERPGTTQPAAAGQPEPSAHTDAASRNTPVRRKLLDMLEKTHMPLAATDLIAGLSEAGLSVNKTTVYRQLDSLVATGQVGRLDLGDGVKRYEIADTHAPSHPHLVCTRCGAIICQPVDESITSALKDAADSCGFEVDSCSIELKGLCENCRKEDDGEDSDR